MVGIGIERVEAVQDGLLVGVRVHCKTAVRGLENTLRDIHGTGHILGVMVSVVFRVVRMVMVVMVVMIRVIRTTVRAFRPRECDDQACGANEKSERSLHGDVFGGDLAW